MRSWMTYILLIAALLGWAQASRAGELVPKVVVTVPAVKPYVDALLEGITTATDLIRPGQDAHNFSLSSSQRQALAHADIIIVADRGMSRFLTKLFDGEAKRGAIIITLSELPGAQPLPFAKTNPWLEAAKEQAAQKLSHKDSHDEHDEHSAKKTADAAEPTDPHLWLDPVRMANIAMPLSQKFATFSPTNRAILEANAQTLATHLRTEVDPAIRSLFAHHQASQSDGNKPFIPFLTYHAAYQYFMARYGLEHRGELFQRPEDYLGARTLRTMLSQSGKVKIGCIFTETQGPLVSSIAKSSGAKVIVLSPEEALPKTAITSASWAKNDYDRMLQKTAESFASCL